MHQINTEICLAKILFYTQAIPSQQARNKGQRAPSGGEGAEHPPAREQPTTEQFSVAVRCPTAQHPTTHP